MTVMTRGMKHNGPVICRVDGFPETVVEPDGELHLGSEWLANARLITAAPDMLEALVTMLNVEGAARIGANSGALKGLDWKWHFDKARAAIAKAEGTE